MLSKSICCPKGVNMKKQVENVIRKAGDIILNTKLDKSLIEIKGKANYVTQVDYLVQEFLTKELLKILPNSNVIAEESKCNTYDLEKATWIIDPVDGTTNLIYGYNHSAISVALYLEGKPSLGFVYNPFSSEMFHGESGAGAYLNAKKIKVTNTNLLENCLIDFGTSPYDKTKAKKTFDIVQKSYLLSRDVRRSGSAALDLAYVACGRLDIFFEMTLQPWDFAAGSIILNEAGGKVTNWQNEDVNALNQSSILATNGFVHEAMHELIKENF